ncbi:MAG: hypothetical protein ACK5AV_04955 [Alphaproteobacteria bacterium]
MRNMFNPEYRNVRRAILEGTPFNKTWYKSAWDKSYIKYPEILSLFIQHYPGFGFLNHIQLNDTGITSRTPLKLAYDVGAEDSVKLLLAQPNINVYEDINLVVNKHETLESLNAALPNAANDEAKCALLIKIAQAKRAELKTLIIANPFNKDALSTFLKANPGAQNWICYNNYAIKNRDRYKYAIEIAASNGSFEAVEILIEHGAYINGAVFTLTNKEQLEFLSKQKSFCIDNVSFDTDVNSNDLDTVAKEYRTKISSLAELLKKEQLFEDNKTKLIELLTDNPNIATHLIKNNAVIYKAKYYDTIQIVMAHFGDATFVDQDYKTYVLYNTIENINSCTDIENKRIAINYFNYFKTQKGVNLNNISKQTIAGLIYKNIPDDVLNYIFATTDIRLPYKKDGYTNPILQKKYEKQCLWDSIEDEIFYSSGYRKAQLLTPLTVFGALRFFNNDIPVYAQAIPLAAAILGYAYFSREPYIEYSEHKTARLKNMHCFRNTLLLCSANLACTLALEYAPEQPMIKYVIQIVSAIGYLASLKDELLDLYEASKVSNLEIVP